MHSPQKTEIQKMEKKPTPLAIIVLVTMPILAMLHIGFYYPALPAQMASHFGPNGEANGYMTKLGFAAFYVVMMAFYAALFAGIGGLLKVLPVNSINLPHKEYWLAPERKTANSSKTE